MKYRCSTAFFPLADAIVESEEVGEAVGVFQDGFGAVAGAFDFDDKRDELVGDFEEFFVDFFVVPRVIVPAKENVFIAILFEVKVV